ncbi:hypothetical protein C0036_04665 [Streptomyces sp. DJ]|nr:hypothetical protein C0036_04665 [Streptomyces sp. DJ]
MVAGGSVTLDFGVADPRDIPQGRLTVGAYVSLFGSSRGHALVDVVFQGETLVAGSGVRLEVGHPRMADPGTRRPGRR